MADSEYDLYELMEKYVTNTPYVNGKRIARVPWNSPIPLGLGEGILGNTFERNYRINNRNWDGAIDELKIFNRAIIPPK